MTLNRELLDVIAQDHPDNIISGEVEGVYFKGKQKDVIRVLEKILNADCH